LHDDLLELLRASACLGVSHGSDEIEVHLLSSVSERHDRTVVTRVWMRGKHATAMRPSTSARADSIVSTPGPLDTENGLN
jgi:hypothetical protein